jgi:hypothetical protein
MGRLLPSAAALGLIVLGVSPVDAQGPLSSAAVRASLPVGSIQGRILDDRKLPVVGALVSVLGRATALATTDSDGRFVLRDLPFGPYLLSAHQRGYRSVQGRTVQLTAEQVSVSAIELPRVASKTPAEPETQLAGFDLFGLLGSQPASELPAADDVLGGLVDEGEDENEKETAAWHLRRLPRNILKDARMAGGLPRRDPYVSGGWLERGRSAAASLSSALFSDLALSGQVNLLTTDSFDSPSELFSRDKAPRNVTYLSVGTEAAGGAWAVQGAMTPGDLSSWIVAGSFRSIDSSRHAYDIGLSYSTQRYAGGNRAALAAVRDGARNVGTVYAFDQWTVSPRLIVGFGSGYARYDYLASSGLWSPELSVTVPFDGFRLKALASRRAIAPGAEEFAPPVTGLWLPPDRTFSPVSEDGRFQAELARQLQMSLERDIRNGLTLRVRAFRQQVDDQLVAMFGVDAAPTSVGHYFVGTAGDVAARGWGFAVRQEVPGYVRSSVEYTVARAEWSNWSDMALLSFWSPAALLRPRLEAIHDLQTSVEATIPHTATRLFVHYRLNTAFSSATDSSAQDLAARFNVRLHQALPFLSFSNADWEMLVDVRNLFREPDVEASVYDEALVIDAPKRVVGGLLVSF